jgi:hypothetical protein
VIRAEADSTPGTQQPFNQNGEYDVFSKKDLAYIDTRDPAIVCSDTSHGQ